MVKVKICGITNLEDALACYFYHADAIGFVFYRNSPRYIDLDKARQIGRILPKDILKVGVFVNEAEKKIKRIAEYCRLDMLQFHGDESFDFCSRFKGYKVIKAFNVCTGFDISVLRRYSVYGFLFDSCISGKRGGTGKKFDWNSIKCRAKIKRPLFLSGGLNSANIKYALKKIKPDWVDLSSSVEAYPGKKDHLKISNFISKIK